MTRNPKTGQPATCEVCGETFLIRPTMRRANCCGRVCQAKLSGAKWNRGFSFTPKARAARSRAKRP